jgi:hypothetical protein
MSQASHRFGLGALVLGVVFGCGHCPPPPNPTCHDPPLKHRNLGSPTPPSGVSSVMVAVRGEYLSAYLTERVFKPSLTDPVEADLTGLLLSEEQRSDGKAHLVNIYFSISVPHDMGRTKLPGRDYRVQLRVLPYLVTPQLIPDPAQRAQMLGCQGATCPDNAVLLDVSYEGLFGGPRGLSKPVDCHAPDYDLIDDQVIQTLFAKLANFPTPFTLPLDAPLGYLQALASPPQPNAPACAPPAHDVHLVGIDLSTDQNLLLVGARLDRGDTRPFGVDATLLRALSGGTFTGTAPPNQWAVWLHHSLVMPALEKLVGDAINKSAGSQLTINSASMSATVSTDALVFGVDGTVDPGVFCPNFGAHISLTLKPGVCNGRIGMHQHVGIDTSPGLCVAAIGVIGLIAGGLISLLFPVVIGVVATLALSIGGNAFFLHKLNQATTVNDAWTTPMKQVSFVLPPKDPDPAQDISDTFYPTGIFSDVNQELVLAGSTALVRPLGPPTLTCPGLWACAPDCSGHPCSGDDGCGQDGNPASASNPGNACNDCATGDCANGACPPCTPCCTPGVCGNSDGCGGTCGCTGGTSCYRNQCVGCVPKCVTGHCGGADGCGGSCGCATGQVCGAGDMGCVCQPSCAPNSCDGDDGCGGKCKCANGQACSAGHCGCVPSCAAGSCGGSDGCGGTCACPAGQRCKSGSCCTPSCAAGSCGGDGCGGTCGCPAGQRCVAGACSDCPTGQVWCDCNTPASCMPPAACKHACSL